VLAMLGFSRIKERNAQRIQEALRKGKLNVIFNSNPVEFSANSVTLDVQGSSQKILNAFVWIFAGGDPPTAFLKKIGVHLGPKDLTSEGHHPVQDQTLVATPVI